MSLKLQIRLIFLYAFMTHTVFILPVIVPFYQDYIGLTFQQFMIGEAVFAAVIIAMEVPSGWLSDIWSRKRTLVLGTITAIIGYSLLLYAHNFWTAILAQAILGIGVACNSGTVTSLLYDSLAERNKSHLYQRLEGKRHAMGLYAVAFAAVIGGILYQYDIRLPLVFDIATLAIAAVCAAFLYEPQRIKRAADKSPLRDMVATMKYALHGHVEIAGIIIVSIVLFSATKMVMWTQQPYMQYVGIPTDYFGYIMAAGFLIGGFAGHFGHKVKHQLSNRHMMMILVGWTVFCCVISAMIALPIGMAFILSVSCIWGYGFPFIQNAIQKHADPARRATILSTMGLCISLWLIPITLLVGWIDEHYAITYALWFLAIEIALLTIIGFWLWGKRTALKPT
jgi:MFS family permease